MGGTREALCLENVFPVASSAGSIAVAAVPRTAPASCHACAAGGRGEWRAVEVSTAGGGSDRTIIDDCGVIATVSIAVVPVVAVIPCERVKFLKEGDLALEAGDLCGRFLGRHDGQP